MVDGKHSTSRSPRIVLAHDWLVGMRGGEYVLDRLCQQFGPTDLYVMVADGRPMSSAIDACSTHTSPMQHWPGATGGGRRWYLPLFPRAVRALRIRPDADLLISTSSAFIKTIQPPPRVPHICYCHSPARYIWSRASDYGIGSGGFVRRAALALAGPSLRRYDRRQSDNVTTFIANSTHIAREIERCYGRIAQVIHPPVRTNMFTPDASVEREPFLLVVSALEPYKRVDLVIDAARARDLPLVVVGSGTLADDLKRRAGSKTEFRGHVPTDDLVALYRKARGLVFPGVEDFGIVPVEAMACGCPVAAYPEGGAEDWFVSDVGPRITSQTVDAVGDAMEALLYETWDNDRCRSNAERFSEAAFDRSMNDVVDKALASRTTHSPPNPATVR